MVVGSAGESHAKYLAHSGAGTIAAGEICIAGNLFGPGFAQGRANFAAAILEVGQFHLALDFYAKVAEALDQQCFMLVLRINNGKWKGCETVSHVAERNAGGGLTFDPKIQGGNLVAAVDHGLSESKLLIELERARLNRQSTRCGAGGRKLVDD